MTAARALPSLGGARAVTLVALGGALAIAFSAILVAEAGVEPATAAFYRCAWAVPVLLLAARWERARIGDAAWAQRRFGLLAGVLFAADLLFWHQSIRDVGAGLSTVLANCQVVIVPFAAWAALSETPSTRVLAALPAAIVGIVLISGVLEHGAYGAHPLRGAICGAATGVAYAGFILAMRQANPGGGRAAGPLADATMVCAVCCFAAGLIWDAGDLVPAWPSAAWLVLLALTSQVLGWLLLSSALPRLPAALSSMLLTFQPLASVLLAIVLLGEDPTAPQLVGAGCIVAGLLFLAVRSRRP